MSRASTATNTLGELWTPEQLAEYRHTTTAVLAQDSASTKMSLSMSTVGTHNVWPTMPNTSTPMGVTTAANNTQEWDTAWLTLPSTFKTVVSLPITAPTPNGAAKPVTAEKGP
jgi:hypothetical protein